MKFLNQTILYISNKVLRFLSNHFVLLKKQSKISSYELQQHEALIPVNMLKKYTLFTTDSVNIWERQKSNKILTSFQNRCFHLNLINNVCVHGTLTLSICNRRYASCVKRMLKASRINGQTWSFITHAQ